MATIREGIFTSDEVWQFMKQKGLNVASWDTGMVSTATTGVDNRQYYSVPTPIRNALELWGIVWRVEHNLLTAEVAASTNENQLADGYLALTYTQPQPPADNNTTDAATEGNLLYRNVYFAKAFSDIVSIAQPATQNAEVTKNHETSMGYIFFDVPLRLALSQLEAQLVVENFSNATQLVYRTTGSWLYKFVQVSDAEYSNLVALASGQAVLTEVLIA